MLHPFLLTGAATVLSGLLYCTVDFIILGGNLLTVFYGDILQQSMHSVCDSPQSLITTSRARLSFKSSMNECVHQSRISCAVMTLHQQYGDHQSNERVLQLDLSNIHTTVLLHVLLCMYTRTHIIIRNSTDLASILQLMRGTAPWSLNLQKSSITELFHLARRR